MLKTAEDLRIKGLAEVSWRDEDDSMSPKSHKFATSSSSSSTLNPARHMLSGGSSANDQLQRASAAYSPRPNIDKDYQSKPSSSGGAPNTTVVIPKILLNERHSDSDELCIQPAKKKRGRPPLDDDFDSYSTPKIAHVECAPTTIANHYAEPSAMAINPLDHRSDDDASHEMHVHSNSMLEQNMEIQIDEDDNALHGNIVPKTERPDTPSHNRDYYDDDDNPSSPLDESGDATTSQVSIRHEYTILNK